MAAEAEAEAEAEADPGEGAAAAPEDPTAVAEPAASAADDAADDDERSEPPVAPEVEALAAGVAAGFGLDAFGFFALESIMTTEER